MKNELFKFAVSSLILLCTQPNAFAQLLLTNGTLIDPNNKTAMKQHLLLDDKEVVARLDKIPANFNGQVVDIKGKYVIPGLIDMHTHAFGNRAPNTATEIMGPSTTAQVVLHAGVTGFVDLFGKENRLYEHRRMQQAGLLGGANIYTSLSCLTAPGGHCSQFGKTRTIANEKEATQHIQALAEKKADVVKLVTTLGGRLPSLSPQLLKFSVQEAHKYGLKTIVHVHTLADIESAIAANVDAITHLPDDGVLSVALAEKLAQNNTVVIPTLACDTDEYEFLFSAVLSSPLASKVASPRILEAYAQAGSKMTSEKKLKSKLRTEKYYQSIKNLIVAKVRLLAGSDGGNYGTIQGFTVHREIKKLADAGLTNWQALASATSDARRFLGKPTGLNVGAQPSVVILDKSPLENIENTQTIYAVFHAGQLISDNTAL